MAETSSGMRLVMDHILIFISKEHLEALEFEDKKLCPGCKIQVFGNLETFSLPSNPGQFNEFSYYKSKNISYFLWAEKVILLSEAPLGKKGIFHLRERLREVYFELLPEKEAAILTAMVLGEKSGLPGEVKNIYQQAGIGHLLAISGLHISIAAMAVYQLVLVLKGSRRLAAACGMASLLFYGTLTGFSISTSRAVLMILLALIAEILGRAYDRETALGFSALWILLQKPGQLFQSGFLLSFGAVLGAGSLYPALEQCFLKQEKVGKSLFTKGLKGAKRAILFQLAVSFITLPVILWFYYEIPVYGMFLNIFLVPLMSLVTGGGLLAGIAGLFSLALGRFLVGGVWGILKLYETAAELSLALPMAVWNPGQPPFWKILIYGLGLLGVFCYLQKESKKRWLVAFELLPLVLLLLLPQKISGIELTFLDVGQGDGTFISCEEGIDMLIDGGSSSEKELGKYRLLPFMKCKGKGRIDYVFLSHLDEDHISGVRKLLEEKRAECLVLPADRKGSEAAEKIAQLGKEKGTRVWWIQPGEGIQKKKIKLTCLAPDKLYNGTNENAASMVLLLEYGDFSALFTGDLEKEGEKVLLTKHQKEGFLPDCAVLKVAHHGSDHSTSQEFLNAVKPEIAVISCSRNNPYGHPGKELLQRLAFARCHIYQTMESGAITVGSDGEKIWVEEFR